jgi:hypothetical protein
VLPKSKKILAVENPARTSLTSGLLDQKFQGILLHLSTILADAEDRYSIILLIRSTVLLGDLIKTHCNPTIPPLTTQSLLVDQTMLMGVEQVSVFFGNILQQPQERRICLCGTRTQLTNSSIELLAKHFFITFELKYIDQESAMLTKYSARNQG